MPTRVKKLLLVEGKDEQYCIPFFMCEHVTWGNEPKDWPVEIKQLNGVDNLLKQGVIEAACKTSGLSALGIIVDANDSFDSRWTRVRERCRAVVEDVPEHLPADGLILTNRHGLRVGVWIMPDNRSRGMLETFLSYLHAPEREPLWYFAEKSCAEAKKFEGTHADSHSDKARIHTYLAWIEPPGLTLPKAIMQRVLDARSPVGAAFATWFKELFQLPERISPPS